MSTSAGRTSEQYAEDVTRIGQVIRAARAAKSLTLNELAQLIQAQGYPKVLASTCSNWELGLRGIMSDMVEPLSVVLGIDPAALWMPEHDTPEPVANNPRAFALGEARHQIDSLRAARTDKDIEFNRVYAIAYVAALYAVEAITGEDEQRLSGEIAQALQEARAARE